MIETITTLALPEVRAGAGDDSSVACLYAVCDYFGIEPHAGGAFEELLERAQIGAVSPEEILGAARDLGLDADYHPSLALDALTAKIEAGMLVLAEIGGRWVVVRRLSAKGLLVLDPHRGEAAVPLEQWPGTGIVIDAPGAPRAVHVEEPDAAQLLAHHCAAGWNRLHDEGELVPGWELRAAHEGLTGSDWHVDLGHDGVWRPMHHEDMQRVYLWPAVEKRFAGWVEKAKRKTPNPQQGLFGQWTEADKPVPRRTPQSSAEFEGMHARRGQGAGGGRFSEINTGDAPGQQELFGTRGYEEQAPKEEGAEREASPEHQPRQGALFGYGGYTERAGHEEKGPEQVAAEGTHHDSTDWTDANKPSPQHHPRSSSEQASSAAPTPPSSGEHGPRHAPKGGVTIAGEPFAGGEFIPAEQMAKATPAEREEVLGEEKQPVAGTAEESPRKTPSSIDDLSSGAYNSSGEDKRPPASPPSEEPKMNVATTHEQSARALTEPTDQQGIPSGHEFLGESKKGFPIFRKPDNTIWVRGKKGLQEWSGEPFMPDKHIKVPAVSLAEQRASAAKQERQERERRAEQERQERERRAEQERQERERRAEQERLAEERQRVEREQDNARRAARLLRQEKANHLDFFDDPRDPYRVTGDVPEGKTRLTINSVRAFPGYVAQLTGKGGPYGYERKFLTARGAGRKTVDIGDGVYEVQNAANDKGRDGRYYVQVENGKAQLISAERASQLVVETPAERKRQEDLGRPAVGPAVEHTVSGEKIHVGELVMIGDVPHVITSVGRSRYWDRQMLEDMDDYGVEPHWETSVQARPVAWQPGDPETATMRRERGERERREREALDPLRDAVWQTFADAEKPVKVETIGGEKIGGTSYDDTYYQIDPEHQAIWKVIYNGRDGDDWSLNNYGSSYVARRVPYSAELADTLRRLAG